MNSIGFIGGGRITKIILNGLKRKHKLPSEVFVSDIDDKVLTTLKKGIPEITTTKDNKIPASMEILFLSVHPKVIKDVLLEIKDILKSTSYVISLAPRFTIKSISEITNTEKIIRMIPNAGSIINKGFNPITFNNGIGDKEREMILEFLTTLGDTPIVPEEKLEAYAIITGMGPTYFWFQFKILLDISKELGISEDEAKIAIEKLIKGSVDTLFKSNLTFDDVMDLIPVRPLIDYEGIIKEFYKTKLEELYNKIKIIR